MVNAVKTATQKLGVDDRKNVFFSIWKKNLTGTHSDSYFLGTRLIYK